MELFYDNLHILTPSDLNECEKLFIKIDTDNDGIISCEEFIETIEKMQQKYVNFNVSEITNMYKKFHSLFSEIGINFYDLLNTIAREYIAFCNEKSYDAFILDLNSDDTLELKKTKEERQKREKSKLRRK